MKKLAMATALLLVCVALSGCITINLQYPEGSYSENTLPELVSVDTELMPSEDAEDFDETELSMEDLGFEFGDLTWEYAGDRTLKPATEADQVAGVQVDFVIEDALFDSQVDEIAYYSDEYINKNFSLIGAVLRYDAPMEDTQFAVVREILLPEEEHDHEIDPETGEPYDDEYDLDPYLTGFDCQYDGEVPPDGAWMRVVGTLREYDYTDPDTGDEVPMLMLKVLHMEAADPQEPITALN